MQIVKLLVAAYGVHIGVNAFARLKAVGVEGVALPFRKGVNDFHRLVAKLGNVEAYGTLNPV